jgi:hypothetical protein
VGKLHIKDQVVQFEDILVEARILAMKKFGRNREDPECFDMVLEEVQDELDEKYNLKVGQLLELEKAVRDGQKACQEALRKEESELAYVINLIEERTPNERRPRSTDFRHGTVFFESGLKVSRGVLAKALDKVQKKRTRLINKPSSEDQLLEKFIRDQAELVFPGLGHIDLNFLDNELIYDGQNVSRNRVERVLFKMINERRNARKRAIAA